MTTTPPEAPTGPPSGERPDDTGPRVSGPEIRDLGRLRRTRHDRKVAGVAGGLARHLDIDPLLVRVAFVVLAFFGGAGVIVYLACWLLVPEDGAAQARLRLDERSRSVALVLVGGIATLALLGDALGGEWWAPWPLLVIGLLAYLVLGARRPPPPAGTADPAHDPAYAPYPSTYPSTYAAALERRDPRRRGPLLFWLTMALVALGIGTLGLIAAAGVDVADSAYPALALAVIGTMLVVGAYYGRAGGLVLAGLVATFATLAATGADRVGGGEAAVTPLAAAQVQDSYRLWAGEIRLDLTEVADLEALDGRTVLLDATVGHIEVVVPEGLDVLVDARIRTAGRTELFGGSTDGSARADLGDGVGPRLIIQAEVTVGEIVFEERSTR